MNTLSERGQSVIEKTDWRTTRREAPHGGFQQRQTMARWGSILSVIVAYQNKHGGASPTNGMIARDTALSVGQVQYHLKEMEEAGLITDNRDFPRAITVLAAKVQQAQRLVESPHTKTKSITEVTMQNDNSVATRPPKRKAKRREPLLEVAKKVAKIIDDTWRKHGRSPNGLDMRRQLNYSSAGMSRVITLMTEEGWIEHERQRHHDYRLTSLGQSALLPKVETPNATNNPVAPPPPDQRNALEHVAPPSIQEQKAPEKPVEAPQSADSIDGELRAMQALLDALQPLSDLARKRVATWVFDKLGSKLQLYSR